MTTIGMRTRVHGERRDKTRRRMSDTIAEAFDRVQLYHKGTSGQVFIDKLSLRKGSVVLDLGCGTGYFSSILAERVGPQGRVIGVDPDENRLKVAKSKYTQRSRRLCVGVCFRYFFQ